MQDSQGVADSPSADLFWEPISERRWGKYISAVEHASLLQAHELAGSPATALEIGAEGGRWAKILADLGWQMVCTDIVADALDVCQERIPSAKCILVDREATDFPCDDESTRMLLAIEVHELVEQDWFIHEAARALETGGLFVGVFQKAAHEKRISARFLQQRGGQFLHPVRRRMERIRQHCPDRVLT